MLEYIYKWVNLSLEFERELSRTKNKGWLKGEGKSQNVYNGIIKLVAAL